MADATFSGDATVVDGTTAAAGTASADVIGGVYNDSIAALGSGNAGLARLTSARALHVNLRDASGNYVTAGGGTQYVEDAALGAVGSATGTLLIGRAATSVPGSVGADADAVGLWALRNGILNVRMVDASGTAVTPAGGPGTQYAEDAAFAGNGTGTLMIARRDDALSTLTPIADDAVGLRVGDKGALWVQISDGSGNQITSFGGGTQYVEDAALGAVGAATGTLLVGRASTTLPTAVNADADAAAVWVTRSGLLNTVLRDTSGNALATGTQYSEDGALGSAPVGTLALARRDDALATLTPVEDDAISLRTSSRGALWVAVTDGSGNQVTSFGGYPALSTKTAVYSTAQTGAVLWTPTSGKKLYITYYQIQSGGTVVGTVQLWFGASGDTAYTRGTDAAIFDGEFAPSATSSPGVVQTGMWQGAADYVLRVTDSAAINPLTVTVWGYEV